MPSTVEQILASAGCRPAGVVRWGDRVPVGEPGVYLVALNERANSFDEVLSTAPISNESIQAWISNRPELTLDRARPLPSELAARLSRFWLPDEVILYIGLARTSVRTRVRQYYSTSLGARSPHAGGHWLKTLANLERLFVHYATAPDPTAAERRMLDQFCVNVAEETAEGLFDPERPLPFANLDWPSRGAKRHGITGSKAPKQVARVSAHETSLGSSRGASGRLTLHAELHRILCDPGNRWMTTAELADAVNVAAPYCKKDGTPVTPFQIHGRTKNYAELFERDGSHVRARDCR